MNNWYERLLRWMGLGDGTRGGLANGKPDAGTQPRLDRFIAMVMETRPDEIDCDEFFAQMEQFAELELSGKDVAALMPRMQEHLDHCGECREEYHALRRALQAIG
ncbi:MAG: hypothetical protein H3C34_18620 [Caldilineaceae bacterium]|nr:hypothetical protein [Caldilineaceae bacterium]